MKQKTILVVDDEPDVRDAFAAVLTLEGYHVVTAWNGREALMMLESATPDLVIVDAMMPVMDGTAMLRAMRADPRHRDVRAIAITAAPSMMDGAEVLAVLQKPVEAEQLLELVGRALGDGR